MMAAAAVATCPSCAAELDRRETGKGVFLSAEHRFPRNRSCPHCRESMHEVLIPPARVQSQLMSAVLITSSGSIRVSSSSCRRPRKEKRSPSPFSLPVLTPEAEEALLNAKAEAMADRKIRQERLRSSVVGEWGDFLTFFYRLVRGDFN